jgi:hypothetical protein
MDADLTSTRLHGNHITGSNTEFDHVLDGAQVN